MSPELWLEQPRQRIRRGFTKICSHHESGDLAAQSLEGSSTGHSPAPCSQRQLLPRHPVPFMASSVTTHLLTDLDPSELGKVETNKIQPVLQRFTTCVRKKAVLAGKNVLNHDLLGFVLPNPVMKALLHLNWQSDRKQVVRNNP